MTGRSRSGALLRAALLLAAASCAPEAAEPKHWNVLLVTLDTTRADALGCYGREGGVTPRLDALAAEGARFARAISTAGLTPMSHASILTGRNPYSHGLRVFHGDLDHRLPEGVPVLPEILASRGWSTAAFVSAYPVSGAFGLDRGYACFDTGLEEGFSKLDPAEPIREDGRYVDARVGDSQRRGDETTDRALAWLDEHGEAGPWHLWIHYFDPHDVSLVPPATFANEHDFPAYGSARNDQETKDRTYALEVSWTDTQVGRVLDWVRSAGQDQETVVVVIADHGQGLADGLARHGWSKHRLLYDWALHVPLILRVPGVRAAGPIEALVRSIDVAPTVLEALDLPPPEGIEGRSLLPLLSGEPDEPRIAYADALNLHDTHAPLSRLPETQRDDLYVAQDGDWKLILHRTHPESSELYHIAEDPLELENVYARFPGEAERLMSFLTERDALRLVPKGAGSSAPDAKALEGLGYTGDGEGEERR